MSLATLANWSVLVPIAAFLAAAIGAWGVLSAFAETPTDVDDRLRRMLSHPGSARVRPGSAMKRQEKLQEKVANAASKLSGALKPGNAAELGKIRMNLVHAGFRGEQAVSAFLGLKFSALLIGLALASPPVYARFGLGRTGLSLIGVAGGVLFYLPGLVVGRIRKKRQEQIFLGLPDALDLMVVCVEAGLGLDAAMRRVAAEMVSDFPVLCNEFSLANFQIQMGRPRRDVLRDLGVRTGVDDLRALAAVIIQAERFGSSIGSALRVQSDSMRVARRQLAEEKAGKVAVKIMIPLILFIFPGVFVVLVGPAGIQIAQNMSTMK